MKEIFGTSKNRYYSIARINIFDYISKYKFNLIFYLLINFVVYLNFILIFSFGDELGFLTIRHFLFSVANCFILTLPYFFLKRNKGLIFIPLFLLNLYAFCNAVYFREYSSLIPFHSFALIGNLNEFGDSIVTKWKDLFFIIPTIVLLITYILCKQKLQKESKRLRIVFVSVMLIYISGILLYDKINTNWGAKFVTSFDKNNVFIEIPVRGTVGYGLIAYWIWQINDLLENRKLTNLEKEKVEQFLKNNNIEAISGNNVGFANKNVILIVAESFESFMIGAKIKDIELTPKLNAILKYETCLYASKVLPQVVGGRSCDAHLILNTGLLPIKNGSASSRFPLNNYYSLAKALKKRSYISGVYTSDSPSFANIKLVCKGLGFDFLTAGDIIPRELKEGEQDSLTFNFAVRKMKDLAHPFFIQIVTISSHRPFHFPKKSRANIELPLDFPELLENYVKSIHNLDYVLGNFVQQLKDIGLFNNSIIIIVGDHNGLHSDEVEKLSKEKYGENFKSEYGFVPFIVINAPYNLHYDKIIGQVDIYPTLIDLLGLSDYEFKGLGSSLFNKQKPSFAINQNHEVLGDTLNFSNEVIQRKILAWEISNLIITTNYFNYDNQVHRIVY